MREPRLTLIEVHTTSLIRKLSFTVRNSVSSVVTGFGHFNPSNHCQSLASNGLPQRRDHARTLDLLV